MGHYINRGDRTASNRWDDIKAILSASVVVDIFDDNNDGLPDANPMAWLEAEAEDQFESGLCGILPLDSLRANPCASCARIVGEFVRYAAAIRFPRAYGRNPETLLKIARDSVDRIRSGKDRLAAQGSPNPPANVGGEVLNGTSSELLDPFEPTYLNGFGSY
jgi:hypothetical protein